MPWSQNSPTDRRTQFIADYLREVLAITELCDLYGVSSKTGYKWITSCSAAGPPDGRKWYDASRPSAPAESAVV